jgi:hypothetical protein
MHSIWQIVPASEEDLPENHFDVLGLYSTYGLILVNGLAFVLLEDSKYQAKVTKTVIPQGEGAAPYMSEPTIGHNPELVWSTSLLYNLSPAFHPNTVSLFFLAFHFPRQKSLWISCFAPSCICFPRAL